MPKRPLKIAVIDAGRVGLSSAIVLAQKHHVALQDDETSRVHMVNAALSPHNEPDMALYLEYRALNLRATLYRGDAVENADLVIIATPTRFDESSGTVDTGHIDRVIQSVCTLNTRAPLVIESTVPVGYTLRTAQRLQCSRLMVAPALLRPGRIMHDRLNPSRLVVGDTSLQGQAFAQLLQPAAAQEHAPTVFTGPSEAEAIQLFAQKQLRTGHPASAVELGYYAERHGLCLAQLQAGLAHPLAEASNLNEVVTDPRPRRPLRLRRGRAGSGHRFASL